MRSNVIKNDSLKKSPFELHRTDSPKHNAMMTRDVTEQALLNNALRTMDLIDRQTLPIQYLLSEDDRCMDISHEENRREETDYVSLTPIEEIIERSSLMGAALGRSITRSEYEYIRRNWRSFFNAPMRFAATDTLRLIEDELKNELLLDKLCSR